MLSGTSTIKEGIMTAHILNPDATEAEISAAFDSADTRHIIFQPGNYVGSRWTGLLVRPGVCVRGRDARMVRPSASAQPTFGVALAGSEPVRIEGFEFDTQSATTGDPQPVIRIAPPGSPRDVPSKARPSISISGCFFRPSAGLGVLMVGGEAAALSVSRCTAKGFVGPFVKVVGGGAITLRDLHMVGGAMPASLDLACGADERLEVLIDNVEVDEFVVTAMGEGRVTAHQLKAARGLALTSGTRCITTFSDCMFGSTALTAAGHATFIGCRFLAPKGLERLVDIDWKELPAQRLRFIKCAFKAAGKGTTALHCSADRVRWSNRLEIIGSEIGKGFMVGCRVSKGGTLAVRETQISARVAIDMGGYHYPPNGALFRQLHALLEAVDFTGSSVQLVLRGGPTAGISNSIRHLGVVLPPTLNALRGPDPLAVSGTDFEGGRLLIEERAVIQQPSVAGMAGDVYLTVFNGRFVAAWVCTRTDFEQADWAAIQL
jgi:hypothetical protein